MICKPKEQSCCTIKKKGIVLVVSTGISRLHRGTPLGRDETRYCICAPASSKFSSTNPDG
jgi:hypothetical protein